MPPFLDPGRPFEAAYPEQLALARKLPGLNSVVRKSKVWPKEDGARPRHTDCLDLYFADYAAASSAAAELCGPGLALPSSTPRDACDRIRAMS